MRLLVFVVCLTVLCCSPVCATIDLDAVCRRAVVSRGDTARLHRVLTKAAAGRPVTIATIGGSITEGSCACTENRYPNQIALWFRATFRHSRVTLVNAGLGGTGSDKGAERYWQDVGRYRPDLVVIEFAVNDICRAEDSVRTSFRSLVKQAYGRPSAYGPAVLLLFTIRNSAGDKWRPAGFVSKEYIHREIGQEFNLPMLSMSQGLWPEVQEGRLNWADYYTTKYGVVDCVHPNDEGHKVIGQVVTRFLESVRQSHSR